jgi:hypothetical protein
LTVHVSNHAIVRAQERVWPALTWTQVKRRLETLAEGAERMDECEWHYRGDADDQEPDYYLLISDGIALAVLEDCAVTTLTRASMGEGARDYRRQQRKKKSRRKQYAAESKGYRADSRRHRARLRREEAA